MIIERKKTVIKLFVSDLDHTLLNDKKQVDPTVQESVRQLIETGVDIGLASGRVDEEIKQIGHRFLNYACHRISENGAFVITADDKKLFSTTMPDEIALKIIHKARSYPFIPIFNVNNQCHVLQKTKEIIEYENQTNISIQESPHLLDQLNDSFSLTKISLVGELSLLKQFELVVSQHFRGQVTFHISSPNCFDVVPLNTSKGAGLKILMDRYKIKAEEVACVGDSYNDISMFQITPHSFSMKHSEKQVRDTSHYTVESVSEVADYILRYNRQHSSIS